MKKPRVFVTPWRWEKGLALLVMLGAFLWGGPARGQGTAMTIATLETTVDEFGRPLVGRDGDEDDPISDLVVIYWASNSMIYPPDYSGNPDPRNPQLATNGAWWIGSGCGPLSAPGTFGASLWGESRPPVNSKLFVRVFNAPTLGEASFFGDSQMFTVNGSTYDGKEQIVLTIDKTSYPVDYRDDDLDGLNNSWERSLGSDPNSPHSDNDGYTDLEEWIAGSDPTDSDSFFVMTRIRPGIGGGAEAFVGWPSMAGKKYILQYAPELSDTDPNAQFGDIGVEVTAIGDYTEVAVTNGAATGRGHFRARATTPPPVVNPWD